MQIISIVGSTASGKSDVALEVAKRDPKKTVILSCDSLLVYRDMVIGTAKPSQKELSVVPHFGIDLVDANQNFTAGDYVRYARPLLETWIKEGKKILIVGGTGFYLKSLIFGVWDAPPTQPELRERLEKETSENLHTVLVSKDPRYAEKVKPNDRYRVIRALEIIESTGVPVSEIQKEKKLLNPLPYPVTLLGIRRKQLELERRIIERTNQMFNHGLVEETRKLLELYPDVPRALNSVGYKEVIEFLNGKMTLPECRERIVISTRQLAKKQRTFFKTFPQEIEWFDLPGTPEANEMLIQRVIDLWEKS